MSGWGIRARFNSCCVGLTHIMVYFPIDIHSKFPHPVCLLRTHQRLILSGHVSNKLVVRIHEEFHKRYYTCFLVFSFVEMFYSLYEIRLLLRVRSHRAIVKPNAQFSFMFVSIVCHVAFAIPLCERALR